MYILLLASRNASEFLMDCSTMLPAVSTPEWGLIYIAGELNNFNSIKQIQAPNIIQVGWKETEEKGIRRMVL